MFNKENPGDKVNVEIQPTNNAYNPKVAAALAGNNPPALTTGWGGGRELQYIDAKVVQPFADPGQKDAGNPSWKADFLSSSLGAVTFNNQIYGIPLAGTQPVFFFYNKALMAKYHLSFPTTTAQLLADVKTLAKQNVTAIALGNNEGWPGLMFLEYFADRDRRTSGVPQHPGRNVKGAWSNPAIIQALTDIQTLAKDNAFEQGYESIDWGTGFTDALIHNGVAAMQLMGDWDIGFMQGYYPGWVASGQMGIGFFPSVPGGKGNPADLEGNTTTYAELSAHISPAEAYVAEKFVAWLFATPAYAKVRGQPRPCTGHHGVSRPAQRFPVEAVPGTHLQRRPKGPVLPVLLGPGARAREVATYDHEPREGVRPPRDTSTVRQDHERAPVALDA